MSCREKDSEVRDLKEKVVHLVRQLELQKAEFVHQEKLLVRISSIHALVRFIFENELWIKIV